MMLMVPAMARAPVSAVGARRISMRSTCSGVRLSRLKPGGTRWPSMSSCVKPLPSPRMRGGPPRPGAPGVVTPGRRRSTSPTVASPNLSISSRPMTIFDAVARRRASVSLSRPPVICTRCASGAAGAAARGEGAEAADEGADAAEAGAAGARAPCANTGVAASASRPGAHRRLR